MPWQARAIAERIYGRQVYLRGLIEVTNYCKNDCMYCGIRRSNACAVRYRLSFDDIMDCCAGGYELGLRTFVLQGSEDGYFTDERLCAIVHAICDRWSDCAVTLSFGESSDESYERLFEAGARRYLLRHETITPEHYAMLHPREMQLQNRIRCLRSLKRIGYQTGCGIMVGTPHQTPETLANDMMFMAGFQPHMVGIGPFLPHGQTPFADQPGGSVPLTLFCLALTRIMLPQVLLPSTTALGTAGDDGYLLGISAGCNVIMPNLSPESAREKYKLYDNKISRTAAEGISVIGSLLGSIGYRIAEGRGDHPSKKMNI